MSTAQIWELTCPGLLEEVGRARRWTRDVLSDSPHADDAALIVTELATNALLHTDSGSSQDRFHLTLTCSSKEVTISVKDSGGTRAKPRIKHPSDKTLHGRGLALVEAIAHRMEVHGNYALGHVVIATLRAKEAGVPAVPTTSPTPSPERQTC
ncbi:ATP-binding protein [Streptomyces sulfonofaciens]|nr:ATP-binding protein [Streptomyces sulfonofaciens]